MGDLIDNVPAGKVIPLGHPECALERDAGSDCADHKPELRYCCGSLNVSINYDRINPI